MPDGPTPATSLGADIRALRRSRGTTLAELARRVGKSVGWLSQVERDLSRPSHADLAALAAALDVPLSLLFGQADAPPREAGRIVRAGAGRRLGDDAGLTETLLSPDLTDAFEVIHSVFAPGASLPAPRRRETQEVGTLVSGRLLLWLGEERFELGPGDSFRIRGEPYRWANPYPHPAVAIWVIAPPVY